MGDQVDSTKSLHLPSHSNELPNGWTWLRLDDACAGIFDCPHSTPKLVSAGPLIVRSQDMISGVFRIEQAAKVSEDTYLERTSKVAPERGDLFYSREGTYFGIAAEVPEHTRVCLGQRMVLIRPKPSVIDFRFLRYWLNSPIMASHTHGYRDGTVAERLNLPTIRALPVIVPPLFEQRAIAHILGTLDDKIELNRRMMRRWRRWPERSLSRGSWTSTPCAPRPKAATLAYPNTSVIFSPTASRIPSWAKFRRGGG